MGAVEAPVPLIRERPKRIPRHPQSEAEGRQERRGPRRGCAGPDHRQDWGPEVTEGGAGMIVYTGGTFDLIHTGHLYLLRQCRSLAGPAGVVVVSLNTDEFVLEYKQRAPIQPY